jgi:hypothetical protein
METVQRAWAARTELAQLTRLPPEPRARRHGPSTARRRRRSRTVAGVTIADRSAEFEALAWVANGRSLSPIKSFVRPFLCPAPAWRRPR